jgi:hypothetical protein
MMQTLFKKSHPLISKGLGISATLILLSLAVAVTHFIDVYYMHELRGSDPTIHSGPWGDLQEWDIRVEQAMEFVNFDRTSNEGPFWNFGSLTAPAVQNVLMSSGLSSEDTGKLLLNQVKNPSGAFVIKPDESILLGLDPVVRSKLYLALSQNPSNRLQNAPYFLPKGDVMQLFDKKYDSNVKASALMKKLLYVRNGYTYFSDPEVILRHIPNPEERAEYLQSLTSQNAVLLKLLIKPDSDIDKPLNYWALTSAGVRIKDLRPLFEAQQRLPAGGSISVLYLLPPMARERLFTTPLTPGVGTPKQPDCHWSALNFFSEIPDDRMSDNDFASSFIAQNYYEIGKAGLQGDLVLLFNERNRVIHSSVYLADDIVFTKNGVNFAQPWILMHEKDMIGYFSALEPVKVAYFRRKRF